MQPFRILFLGEFGGDRNRIDLKSRKPLRVDRDSIDAVMSHLQTELTLAGIPGFSELRLEFHAMDDFHPDWIVRHLPQPTIESALEPEAKREEPTRMPQPPLAELTSGSFLDAALSQTEAQTRGTSPSTDPLRAYVNQVVAPHQLKKPPTNPEGSNRTAEVLRAILHHPDFRKLEATWRALSLVVSRLETDESLQLFIFDLNRAELAADTASADDLESTQMFRVIAGEADRWAIVAADFVFNGDLEDLELLRRIGLLCGSAGVPLIAEAAQSMLGCDSVAATPDPRKWKNDVNHNPAWARLRAMPVAQWIGMAAPRFLARLPYGEGGTTIDSFAFEEAPVQHDQYLWASPAYLVAMLIGQAFTVDEWDLRPGLFQNVGSLPLYIKTGEDGAEVLPVAEALLTEFAGDRMLDLGIMPLMSFKDQDMVRLMRFQSIADPLAPIAGRWQ